MLVEESAIKLIYNQIRNCITVFEDSFHHLNKDFANTYFEWNDQNYLKIGEIIDCANSKVKDMISSLNLISLKLKKMIDVVREMEEGGSDTPIYTSERDLSNSRSGLRTTNQTFTTTTINGTEVSVFDHPNESAQDATYGQGECVVNGQVYGGTCGNCAISTLLRRTGLNTTEYDVVSYAASHTDMSGNTLCITNSSSSGERGGTTLYARTNIARAFGLDMENSIGRPLSEIADEVEKGKGAIITVQAGKGEYNPGGMYNTSSGIHALVLNSVARDASTGEIIGYYVIDSNGNSPETASIYVDARELNHAYRRCGMTANITREIIW